MNVQKIPTKITFFEWLEPSIVSGNKTITIRDKSEMGYVSGTEVDVHTLETDRKFARIKIVSVEPLWFDDINEFHAQQEYMELDKLKALIKEIYPDEMQFYVITYRLV
ncbi:N(4)-acetylcytidine aminohydrolase [Vibrio proteolyticus]